MQNLFSIYFQSPLGFIEISGTENYITQVEFTSAQKNNSALIPDVLKQCQKELEEYFAGNRKKFSVKLKPEGTDFQQQVWNELQKIKYGETASYLFIAEKINNPKAVRAVGSANGKNPIVIIIPCHRIIGENGKLTGYGGGLWRKQWLLEHEENMSGKNLSLF